MGPARSVLLILVTTSLLSHGIQSSPTYVHHFCKHLTFTANGSYQANLNKLLTTLSSNATFNKNGFFNFSITGAISDPINTVYGLYMCRGDVTVGACSACVSYAVKDVAVRRCPKSKEAYIWYDECSLRYSDSNIFGSDQEDPSIYLYNINYISEPNQLAQFIGTTMSDEMANKAASDTSGRKFATKQVKLSRFHTLYSLVQCTPDLTVAGCVKCIKTGISYFPSRAKGARALLPSCFVRYETYPFYNFPSVLINSSSPQATPSPVTRIAGKTNTTSKVIVAITVPVVALALLVIGGLYIVLIKRANKKPYCVITTNDESERVEMRRDCNDSYMRLLHEVDP